jgi:predicted amidohydrolase YtcJ
VTDLILRNVEIDGRSGFDVSIRNGHIESVDTKAPNKACDEIDARGCALLPGLIDHHIHLLAFAAQFDSIVLSPENCWDAQLREAERQLAPGRWLRATGYHESFGGVLDRYRLDTVVKSRPARVQHTSGALWVLNSAAIQLLGIAADAPPGVERDAMGTPTGRIYREDAWLHRATGSDFPSLGRVAAMFDAFGVTGLTDASVTNDVAVAELMAGQARTDGLHQRVHLMTADPDISLPPHPLLTLGPVKIMLDDEALGDPLTMVDLLRRARNSGRRIAVHCVTMAQLAYALAAFVEGGVKAGDRIEHGSVIDNDMADLIANLGLTVVSQPGFVAERGDRYIDQVSPADHVNLYRLAGLKVRRIRLAGSSDAPYSSADPWAGMRAAVARRTKAGRLLGPSEGLNAWQALNLYLGTFSDPGASIRTINAGCPADLCLMMAPLRVVLGELQAELVRTTIVAGRVIIHR